MQNNTMDLNQLLDHAKPNRFHLSVIFWCLLIIIFDGYDLVIYGVALPLLMQEWQLSTVQAGMLASIALFGMMFGAMLFGTLSDKIGRKKTIILCLGLFSGFTFLGGLSETPLQFALLRFMAGLGIGGVMPNVTALTVEYAPKSIRNTLVTLMFSGYAIGGMSSALLGSWLVPVYGWQIMFLLGGIPLIALPLIWKLLPESLQYVHQQQRISELKQIVQRLKPQADLSQLSDQHFQFSAAEKTSTPIKALFANQRMFSTLMFWLAFFMCLLMVYALGSWLPKLMIQAGYSLGTSLLFLLALNLGGMIGAIAGGMLSDKFHPKPVLVAIYVLGALALILLGFKTQQVLLYLLIAIAGAATIGAQIVLYSFIAQFYPFAMRSTGIGWASGIGRIGAIVGPVLTGSLLSLGLAHHLNFVAIAIPGFIAAMAVLAIKVKIRPQHPANTAVLSQH